MISPYPQTFLCLDIVVVIFIVVVIVDAVVVVVVVTVVEILYSQAGDLRNCVCFRMDPVSWKITTAANLVC